MKLWSKHWLSLRSRSFGSRLESPFLLLSVEKGSLGEKEIPVTAKPLFRHYMSNVFMYLMPADAEQANLKKGLVHGWELKLGMPIEEAKEVATRLNEVIELCEKRRGERHKQQDREIEADE